MNGSWWWLLALAVVAVGIFWMRGGSAAASDPNAPAAPWTRITGGHARGLVKDGALLLDVRTPQEFGAGHLEGAQNIPVQALSARLAELDKARPIVLYCRSGARSGSAMGLLKSAGFAVVYDLGPMTAW
jgi:phage shock protein E